MMLTWKYTLPAFLVPFVFTLTPEGLGMLMQGTPAGIVTVTLTAAAGIAALAAAFGGWIRGPASALERGLAGVAGGAPLLRRRVGGPGWPGAAGRGAVLALRQASAESWRMIDAINSFSINDLAEHWRAGMLAAAGRAGQFTAAAKWQSANNCQSIKVR